MKRRRRKPHALNPLRYLTPEVVKAIALCAVAAAPGSVMSKKADDRAGAAETKLIYANMNTNAALSIVSVLSNRVDSLAWELDRMRVRQARMERRSPEAMVGPPVPETWLMQPPKRSLLSRLFGR